MKVIHILEAFANGIYVQHDGHDAACHMSVLGLAEFLINLTALFSTMVYNIVPFENWSPFWHSLNTGSSYAVISLHHPKFK